MNPTVSLQGRGEGNFAVQLSTYTFLIILEFLMGERGMKVGRLKRIMDIDPIDGKYLYTLECFQASWPKASDR